MLARARVRVLVLPAELLGAEAAELRGLQLLLLLLLLMLLLLMMMMMMMRAATAAAAAGAAATSAWGRFGAPGRQQQRGLG